MGACTHLGRWDDVRPGDRREYVRNERNDPVRIGSHSCKNICSPLLERWRRTVERDAYHP